jgi:hypothetical protein
MNKALVGHHSRVRALQWDPEVPFVVHTGSWDATIRVWDIRNGACIRIVTDHHADVYGLAVHPSRPFFYASSSRDTTLRFWVAGDYVQAVILDSIWSASVDKHLTNAQTLITAEANPNDMYIRFCGNGSRQLQARLNGAELLDQMRHLANFFLSADGVAEFRDICKLLHKGKSPSGTGRIVHKDAVVGSMLAEAQELEDTGRKTRFTGLGGRSREDCLHAAAGAYARCGEMRRYCEIMVELGQYSDAIAVAPVVSMEYWRQLVSQHGRTLAEQSDIACMPLLVASADIEPVLGLYESRNESRNSFAVAKQLSDGSYDSIRQMHNATPSSVEASSRLRPYGASLL